MLKRRRDIADEGAYQVDIVVTFFAILLVVFVVYAAARQTQVAEPSLVDFKPKETGQLYFRDRAFAVPHRLRSFWILRNGTLYELDMTAIARALQRRGKNDTSIFEKDNFVDVYLYPASKGIGRYRLELIFSGPGLPKGAYAQAHALPDGWQAALKRMMALQRPQLIFVWHDQIAHLADMMQDLRRKAVPFDVFFVNAGENSINISNEVEYYGLDAIMRTY